MPILSGLNGKTPLIFAQFTILEKITGISPLIETKPISCRTIIYQTQAPPAEIVGSRSALAPGIVPTESEDGKG